MMWKPESSSTRYFRATPPSSTPGHGSVQQSTFVDEVIVSLVPTRQSFAYLVAVDVEGFLVPVGSPLGVTFQGCATVVCKLVRTMRYSAFETVEMADLFKQYIRRKRGRKEE